MKYNQTCTCGNKMSLPNYTDGNNSIYWCRDCGRIKYLDWAGRYRSIKPNQDKARVYEVLRKLLKWAEGMYILSAGTRDKINWTALEEAREELKERSEG